MNDVKKPYCNYPAMELARNAAPELAARGCSSVDILVLIIIASHCSHDKEPVCWLGLDRIADFGGMHRNTVRHAIDQLTNQGALRQGSRPGRSSLFYLLLCCSICCFLIQVPTLLGYPYRRSTPTAGVQVPTPQKCTTHTPGVHHLHRRSAPPAPEECTKYYKEEKQRIIKLKKQRGKKNRSDLIWALGPPLSLFLFQILPIRLVPEIRLRLQQQDQDRLTHRRLNLSRRLRHRPTLTC